MKTRVIKINPQKIEENKIKQISQIIKKNGTIIFPTDTIYGIGANALSKKAIAKVYSVKKRAKNKPLSINIAYKKDLKKFVKKISPKARKLIKEFWPGPLTIIFEKSNIIPSELTGGSPYIGIRIPNNKIAIKIIKMSNVPLISTSVNLSGKLTITEIKDIIKSFNKKIDIIINSKIKNTNKESTIVDLTRKKPLIIREGSISVKKLEKYLFN